MTEPEIAVPLTNVTKLVRQLSHDLRNYLNAAELQAAYISEIAEGDEVKSELKRLREIVSEVGSVLQSLTSALGDVKLTTIPYPVRDFIADLRQKVAKHFPDSGDAFEWQRVTDENATIEIDPQYFQQALLELFDNALRYRGKDVKIVVATEIENDSVVLKLMEPKSEQCDPSGWSNAPLRSITHGHYGLGLHRARRIIEAHNGSLEAQFDRGGGCLISSVRLPLAH